MSRKSRENSLVQLINRCICEGFAIEIDGLGRFDLDPKNQVIFEPSGRVRIFLAYADEDRSDVRKLYHELHKAGFEPWMDQEKLLPGQNWPQAIERAIELSDFVVTCFSQRSTLKRGYFQCELRQALDVAGRLPLEDIFLVPLRLDDCDLPRHIKSGTQYIDLCPDWDAGVQRLIKMIRREMIERNKRKKKVL